MPIRNEAAFIEQSLGAVLAQDYPADCMEIVIADGLSNDGTRDVIASLEGRSPNVSLKLLDNPNRLVAAGMNVALACARGEVIVRVDGHTVIAPDYVRECVAALQRTGARNVGGRMEAVSGGWFGQAVALATSSPFGVGGARFHYSDKEEWVDTVYMGAWPREVFERIGLFDEEMVRNQDDELNYRLRSSGGKILLSPKIRSRYYNRTSARALWSQYFQYGLWKVRVMQKHPRQMHARQFMPSAFVAASLTALVLLPFTHIGKYLVAIVLGSYLIANLCASAWTVRNNAARLLPLVPFTFITLHLSYGVGFLFGLLKFWNRWGRARNGVEPSIRWPNVKRI